MRYFNITCFAAVFGYHVVPDSSAAVRTMRDSIKNEPYARYLVRFCNGKHKVAVKAAIIFDEDKKPTMDKFTLSCGTGALKPYTNPKEITLAKQEWWEKAKEFLGQQLKTSIEKKIIPDNAIDAILNSLKSWLQRKEIIE